MSSTEAPKKTKRRWYQYSLRALMIVVTVATVAFGGWVHVRRQQARENRQRASEAAEALEWFENSGGDFLVFTEHKDRRPQTWLEKQFDDPGPADDPTLVLHLTVELFAFHDATEADIEKIISLKRFVSSKVWGVDLGEIDWEELRRAARRARKNERSLIVEEATNERLVQSIEKVGGRVHKGVVVLRKPTWMEFLFGDPGDVDDRSAPQTFGSVRFGRQLIYETNGYQQYRGKPWRQEPPPHYPPQDINAALESLNKLPGLSTLTVYNVPLTDTGLKHVGELSNLTVLAFGDVPVTNANLRHLQGLKRLEYLSLSHSSVSDAGLRYLRDLTNLQWLYLNGTQVSDAGLEHLKALKGLRRLDLGGTQVNGSGLGHLSGMKNLTEINLRHTPTTDAGLKHLSGLKGIERLLLTSTQITDAGLERLKGMKGLEYLLLTSTQITDAGLEHLKGMKGLEYLDLRNTQITDAGLKHLTGLKGLRYLLLLDTQITDAGLVYLKEMKGLKDLSLSDSNITDEGRRQLEQALPGCTITDYNLFP